MSNVILKMSAFSNIGYNNEYDTMIPEEEWAEMSYEQRVEIKQEALWEDIEVIAANEEGTYLD